jgi:2',3'-cyclic-nucleotide 2'-phosphodiesterase/3'-nucleotidase
LAANLLDSAGNLLFTPFTKVTVDGISIAVLGLSLATSPDASDAPGRATFLVRDLIETATEWVPVLRNKEKADAVVVLMHIGVNGLNGQRYDQNAAFSLLDAVPGIDAVVASQAHRPMVARHKGVPVVQPAPFGGSRASRLFTFQRTGKQWTLKSSEPGEIPMDHTFKVDPTVLRQTKSLLVETEEYLNTFATRLGNELDGRWSTVVPTALLQLVHDVQKKATGAQLCAVPSPGTHIFVQNGPTSVRQFYALAPHEDRIAMIQITGAQLRAYLEHAAKHFNFSHLPELINESVPIEDYDVLGGCSYALDISRPPGKRVTSLKFGGKPVEDSLTFTMAITSSRLAGAGGYMEAIGFNGRHQTISKETLRNLLLEYVLATPSLNIRITGDWRTIPFLDRSRVTGAYK